MLLVYGDESMDETKQRVCAVAGIIGTEEQWNALAWKWARRTNGVPFHGNHCESDRGDYLGRPHWENQALYRDLAILLADSGLAGYGQSIDLIARKRDFPGIRGHHILHRISARAFCHEEFCFSRRRHG
jgi:hypothetical protein